MKTAAGITQVVREERRDEPRTPLSFGIIRRLFTYMRPYRGRRNLLFLLVVVRSVQLPCLAWAIAAVIGGPVTALDAPGVLLGTLGYALLALFTQFILHYRSRLALELGEDVIHDLRDAMFRHIQRLPMQYFVQNKVGRIISRFTSDAESVRVGIQDVMFVSMVNGGQMLIAGGMMLWADPVLFLIVAAMAPAIWAVNRHFRSRFSAAFRAVQESFSRVTATLAESVSGIRVTQGYSREDLNAGLFRDLVAEHSMYNLTTARTMGVFLPLLEFNTQFFVASVLMAGSYRVMTGSIEVEVLYKFILLSQIFFGPIQVLGQQYSQAMNAMAGAERVFRLLDRKPDWEDPPDAVRPESVVGEVVFDRVGFEYVAGRPVLQDVSFRAEAGQTVALVGHTGSGKSTIINLIAKFYLPTSGLLTVDGTDITTLDSRALQRHLGIVLQQNFLFSGRVLDNIRIGNESATEEHVREAAARINCLDILDALPDGLHTVVGEGGKGISLGQRQLICFTRAMLADPAILILDEATSAVDTMTEARIQKALAVLLANRTSFVVAHRLSTIRHADQVLVLREGRITERGTHESLLAERGEYAQLYRQFVRATSA